MCPRKGQQLDVWIQEVEGTLGKNLVVVSGCASPLNNAFCFIFCCVACSVWLALPTSNPNLTRAYLFTCIPPFYVALLIILLHSPYIRQSNACDSANRLQRYVDWEALELRRTGLLLVPLANGYGDWVVDETMCPVLPSSSYLSRDGFVGIGIH